MLNKKDAENIIDLNPSGVIDPEIAARQFSVIWKAYNHLCQKENQFIYIADEVGLGKTYIALGIASLLRRFCAPERRSNYKDVIIVPKYNLQQKWIKEINNFILNNYKSECNIVKSVLGKPIGKCDYTQIHHHLEPFSSENPTYELYRNSSFSIATSGDNNDWHQKLEELVPKAYRPIFQRGRALFGKNEEDFIYLKRLYAYIMNLTFPEMDLLIVDEAHNYKHGINDGVAIRNQIVSRLMGNVSPDDRIKIFQQIPELPLDQIKPKAKKVIFLSATPIDNGLHEIKQQFDCFMPNHPFKHSEAVGEEIKQHIGSFMIRGLMNITLSQETEHEGRISRNMYRHEHRRGNVEKEENAAPQFITDDLESIVLGLMQYKTLKQFNESNTKNFEIGMLAAFETFNPKIPSEQEYEETSNRTTTSSADHKIVERIATSYFDHFQSHLPHPKQDNLVDVLFEGIKKQNKSLVFVRRIASVVELERKLNLIVEEWQFSKIKRFVKNNDRLKALEKAFNERHQILEIVRTIEIVSEKILEGKKNHFSSLMKPNAHLQPTIAEYLLHLYYSENTNENYEHFRKFILANIKKSSLKRELKDLAFMLVTEFLTTSKGVDSDEKEEITSEGQEEVMTYFFTSYFSSKRYIEGFNFRKRIVSRDWYKFNLFHITEFLPSFQFDTSKLRSIIFKEREKTSAQRMDLINDRLIESHEHARNKNLSSDCSEVDPVFRKKTFFNLLLEGPLRTTFQVWIDRKYTQPSKGYTFLDDLDALTEIFQGVFRNGSGLLPAFTAECLDAINTEQNLIERLINDFPEVLKELEIILTDFDKIVSTNFSDRSKIQRSLYGQYPVNGASGFHKRDISRVATQFRMPGYPYVLISTDVLKEGEDLHLYCKDVYHYGIAWNPSDMEQRTGRIDRINSSTYFQLKKEGKRNFQNALQVFYPYLADTLEVNQVAKVFSKMNDFIQTFYDVSIIREKDTQVSTDEIVKEIPSQIKSFLHSKFDHDNGNWPAYSNETTEDIEEIGYDRMELIEKLNATLSLLNTADLSYHQEPFCLLEQFTIRANVSLSGRNAPLKITLVNGIEFNQIDFSIESPIGRTTHSELRKTSVKTTIVNSLVSKAMDLTEYNDFLMVRKRTSIETAQTELLKAIIEVIEEADQLENNLLGMDDTGF